MLTYDIKLDVSSESAPRVVYLKQYQTDVQLVFWLYTTVGTLEIGSVSDCSIRGTKSDGNGFSASATYSSSNKTVSFHVTSQMTAVAGKQPFELTLTDSTGKMITATFYLDIKRAALDGTTVSASEIRELVYALDHTDDILRAYRNINYLLSNLFSESFKNIVLDCLDNLAWATNNGAEYRNALEDYLDEIINMEFEELEDPTFTVIQAAIGYNVATKNVGLNDIGNNPSRRAAVSSTGVKPYKTGTNSDEDSNYYPLYIPNGVRTVTVSITPSAAQVGLRIVRLENNEYVNVINVPWTDGQSVTDVGNSGQNLYACVHCRSGSSETAFATEPVITVHYQ